MPRWCRPFRSVSELMQEISHASSSQTNDMLNVTQAIVRMDEATQQNAALVKKAAAAAGSLSTQARELVQAVAVFRLRRQACGHRRCGDRTLAHFFIAASAFQISAEA